MNPRSIDKQQAQELIKETFESSFDKVRFTNFIKNLLNRIDDAPFTYQGSYIPDAYKQYIKKLERIGKFSDGENRIDILVITLQKDTSLERSRTMQRNFIAWYLNGSRGGKMKEAALAAFVSPGKDDWRFSLVKMDYKFEQTKSGSMKVKEEFTPARRWSFLVGKNEKSHTAQSRLVKILANDEQDPTLGEIQKAFDIETVTKEFFIKYRELFLRTKEELDRVVKKDPKIKADFEVKGVDTVNFAKKLLGQIIFLYFLQKKGWFGVGRDDDWGTGSKHFLRELFEKKHGDYINFFNDILEPLFYEALRTGEDRKYEDYYYSRFNCKIPFLNGGLFDPIGNYDWVHIDIFLPNKLFSNQTKTKEGDTGTGVLDVFDRYNFTVKEDEPLEKEVAIDPELLGKSYEKFNAIRPDNFAEFKKALKSGKKGEENKFNKKFGVYYTPREIVHYMCQQSLINYLDTAVNAHKESIITKPAVQKKIFGPQIPVQQTLTSDSYKPIIPKKDIEKLIQIGEQVSENEAIFLEKERKIKKGEQKTTSIKPTLPESIRKNAKLIDDKLAEITVCDPAVGSGAFPVGMMSEIVKIRNVLTPFLSLRGAQATKQSQFDDNRTVYNFKRHCIEHSLYGVDIDPGAVEIAKLRLWLSLVVDEDDIKNIKPLPNLDYKIVCGNSLLGYPYRPRGLDKIEILKEHFLNETRPKDKIKLHEEIDEAIYGLYENTKKSLGYQVSMDFNINFSEVFHRKGGFDIVIANPPYGLLNKRQNKAQTIVVTPQELHYYKTSTEYDPARGGMINIFRLFILKSIYLIQKSGVLSEIFPLSFIADASAAKLRKYILNRCSLRLIEAFPERDNINKRVFEEVKMSVCVMVLTGDKGNTDDDFFIRIHYPESST
ncbi:MAG: N-6 DNA methylase [Anaerolineales bacterium]|nr:N-6 DNA methylase [Anaerolineales bacterium]